MFIYFIPLFLSIFYAFASPRRTTSLLFTPAKIVIFLLILFIFGLADGLGPDYLTLERNQFQFSEDPLDNTKSLRHVLYTLLAYSCSQLGFGLSGVNFVCCFLLFTGIYIFLRQTSDFWLGFIYGYPAYVVISSINFNRQSAALGLSLIGITFLLQHKKNIFFVFLALASMFHSSSLMLLPLVFVSSPMISFKLTKRILLLFCLSVVAFFVVGSYILTGLSFNLINFFGTSLTWVSRGIWFRLIPILISCFLAFVFRRRLFPNLYTRNIFFYLACLSIIITSFAVIYPSFSTVSDRLSLYLLPLPIYVLPQLPRILPFKGFSLVQYKIFTSSIVLLFLYGWLSFSPYSQFLIPYKNILL